MMTLLTPSYRPPGLTAARRKTIPIIVVAPKDLAAWKKSQDPLARALLTGQRFTGEASQLLLLPPRNPDAAYRCLVGAGDPVDPFALAAAARQLDAAQTYHLEPYGQSKTHQQALVVGWSLGCEGYHRKTSPAPAFASLTWPKDCDRAAASRLIGGICQTRALINAPAQEQSPHDLAQTARRLAKAFGARITVWQGRKLDAAFPALAAVGNTSPRPPRMIDLTWGAERTRAPRVTLVGKGVCFDTGGLNLKPAPAMLLMKKDMGGAAHALGLAAMIMHAKLNLRLRVLIPAADNVVDGNAMRPLDIITTRKGLTIEVGHTDAEGRVILADALAAACEQKPDLLLDFATLTGAARVALGSEIPALFSNDEKLAREMLKNSRQTGDPLWQLPLYGPYARHIKATPADITNASRNPFGGAIEAALFLKAFVDPAIAWAHLDMMAYTIDSRPGRPRGGEAMGLRTCFALLAARYGTRARPRGRSDR
ncbi:MAG: leucyl aminopeptidase family protein [Pseudomonadota bacterium]